MPGNTPTGLLPTGPGAPGVPGTEVSTAAGQGGWATAPSAERSGLSPGHVDFKNFSYSGFNDTVGGA
jgi:hypothetical protein